MRHISTAERLDLRGGQGNFGDSGEESKGLGWKKEKKKKQSTQIQDYSKNRANCQPSGESRNKPLITRRSSRL